MPKSISQLGARGTSPSICPQRATGCGDGVDGGGGLSRDGDGFDDGGHQVDIVVLGQQAGNLGAALVYVDHLEIHQIVRKFRFICSWCLYQNM